MAEGVLFNVAGQVMKKLSSHASQEFGMLCGLEDDFTKLTSSVLSIKAVLRDAEERQIKSHSVKDWLEKLKEALYDADDVLDEFSCESLRREVMTRGKNTNQVSIFFSKFNHVSFDLKMAHKIKHVRERLDVIAAEKYKFHFVENLEQKTQRDDELRTRSVETYSFSNEELIGREDDKKAIKDLLLDMNVKDNVSFIAIVGIGGIGKTTLAKSLYNDSEVLESFELKMWVCVSDEFDVKIVVGKIIEAATNRSPSVRGMESLQSQLQKVIQGKKYLLVMDDIWNESEEKWFHLKNLLMGGARGSKIMITKRDSILAAEIANMTSLLTLKRLSESHSWSLFRKVAFKEGKEPTNLNLIQLGKEILVKCKGVPIVIRHIGRLLYCKTSEEEWISFKSNELLEVIQRDHNMTSMLKLSYNNLPPNLKQCFAYSSLFLKDESINKDELIRQWVAHGFLESPNGSKSMEDIGNDYLTELCWRFFYEHFHEDIPYEVYMHDLMHDLARMVAGNEYVYGNLKFDYVGQKIRHVSFDHEIKSQWDFLYNLGKVEGLRTFLIPYNPHKRKEINETILDELFSNCSYLRVLDLKCSNIKIVPDSIKKLKHLRYLDLSGNEDMELLPNSISELQNLQTLNLNGCYALKELPRVTSNLVNLRHLDVTSIPLTHMPEGMGKLTCLQTLSSFVLSNNGQGSRLSELNGLNNLRGWLHIKGLEQLRSTPSEASIANLKDKKGLRHLTLEWKLSCDEFKSQAACNTDEMVFECLEPHPSVEILCISGYSGERLTNWVSNQLRNLTHIIIEKCHGLHNLPQFGHLPSLQHLTLDTITPLKFIENNEYPYSSSVFFPSLEYLWLENMPNLEGWWERESTVEEAEKHGNLLPTFPRLSILSISNCPKLASMPGHPPLKEVTLDGVGLQMMSSIISQMSSLESLKLTQIEDLEYLPWNDPYSSPTSLSDLDIMDCPKLKSLPEGMRLLKLDYLHIAGCPELEERCKEGGEDWSKIAHLPYISISHHLPVEGDEDTIYTDTTHSSQVEVAEGESEIWKKMKDSILNTLSFILTCGRTTHNET